MSNDEKTTKIPADSGGRLPAPADGPSELLTPKALTPETLARLLTAAGGKAVTIDIVQTAIDVSSPKDPGVLSVGYVAIEVDL